MRARPLWMLLLAPIVTGTTWSAEYSAATAVSKTDVDRPAGERVEGSFDPHRLVTAALTAEARGDFATRERLLRQAARTGAEAAANAHLGLIDVGTQKPDWKTIDETMSAASKDSKLLRYEHVRRKTPDTAAGNLELAQWCLARKMLDQTRAHLMRLLDFVPDHAAARAALGYVRMGDRWVGPAEIQRLQARAQAKATSIEQHRKTLSPLLIRLRSKNPADRAAVGDALLALRDPTMVGAIETALDSPDPFVSKLLVAWMAQVDVPESSLVLARYGVLHPDEAVRSLAMDKLAARPLHDFVPELLAMLSSPVTMLIQPSFDPQGRMIGYRQAFGREGMGENDIQVIDREFQRVLDGGSLTQIMAADVTAEAMIRQQAAAEVEARRLEMERQNALIEQVNTRITAVVARVSGRLIAPVAADMWHWWDAYNETEYQADKTARLRRSYSVSTVAVSAPPESSGPPDSSTPPRTRHECFVAGTPVITKVGPRAIETILPGDLVLNRDLETGALRWKPVLKATTRPPTATIAITLAETGGAAETFRCSTGHLFWVSGKGWKKASELQAGDVLHAAKTPVRIASVQPLAPAQTHNLEVADAPNYFVGHAMVLTHDVTPRGTNRQAFPGQDQVQRSTAPLPRD
jgi:hypothetical protein